MIKQYNFNKTKYGEELLVDLINLEYLKEYITKTPIQRLTYYDITIISNGQGTFSVNNILNEIKRGSVLFSSPGQIREWNIEEVPKGYVLIFEEEFLCNFFNDAQFVQNLSFFNCYDTSPSLLLNSEEYSQLLPLIENIRNEISIFRNNDKHVLRALLYQVLILLNRKFVSNYPLSEKKPNNRYVDNFIQLVNLNHQQYRSVSYYAQQLNVTAGHLNSLVKQYTGINAKRYILNRNILEAKRMLSYTDLTVDEIASNLNYENTTYFIRIFREHTHTTPLHFRRKESP